MSEPEKPADVLVYYPGHLGDEVVARLRSRGRALRFAAGQVRLVPAADAADLTHPSLGGYHRAVPRAQAAEDLGLAPTTLGKLIAAEKVTTALYRPPDAPPEAEPEIVVVLDPATRRIAKAPHPLTDEEPPPPPPPPAPTQAPVPPESAPAPLTATATPAKPKPARRKSK
ncbi:MAG TPA: hypothetical protein VNJ70_17850 [Thermoanaerobaculia bacterium]|nr:hypothetical protein [Thermoanaerobaculia bacterium]